MNYNNNWIDAHYFDIMISRIKNIKDRVIQEITYDDYENSHNTVYKKDIKEYNKDELLDDLLDKIKEKYGKNNKKTLLKSRL